jgi:uncharacterized protein (TIGR03085 family)
VTHAQDERQALCDLLAEVGPDQPTLCAGWQTSDLAAHLVLRERRPDAGAGVMGGPVARYTRRVQRHLADRHSFARLINTIRTGPPRLSVFGLPGADEKLNLVEYFVHHEDVLRARPDWQPRKIDAELTDELWDRLNMARLMLRSCWPASGSGTWWRPGQAPAQPRADHRQGAHSGRDGDWRSGRAHLVDYGPDHRRGRAYGRRRRRRGRAALGSLAVVTGQPWLPAPRDPVSLSSLLRPQPRC